MSGTLPQTQAVEAAPRWYVARTQPHKETRAQHHLHNQGFETFLPQITRTIRHARQFRRVRRPLFPQYIFVKLDPQTQAWRSINGTIGVVYLITSDERPTPVPDGLTEMLVAMTDNSGEFHFASTLKPGDPVLVKSGPFANFAGKLERLDAGGRALLFLEMMGQEVRVWSKTKDLSVAR